MENLFDIIVPYHFLDAAAERKVGFGKHRSVYSELNKAHEKQKEASDNE